MIATMIWYSFFGIAETNPTLIGPIEKGLIYFALVKIIMSIPGLALLYKKIKLKVSQYGLFILLIWYIGIFFIHWYIFVSLIFKSA